MIQDLKRLTCIVPRGEASDIMHQLFQKPGYERLDLFNGRGQNSVMEESQWAEVDVIHLIIEAALANEAFETLYEMAEIALKPGRFLFQEQILMSSEFVLPDTIEKEI